VSKSKIAGLERRSISREVQLGQVEAELLQQAKRFEEAEAELTEDVLDAYDAGFADAFAQVFCAHQTVSQMGKSFTGSFLNLCLVAGQTIYYLLNTLLSRTYSYFHFLKSKTAL